MNAKYLLITKHFVYNIIPYSQSTHEDLLKPVCTQKVFLVCGRTRSYPIILVRGTLYFVYNITPYTYTCVGQSTHPRFLTRPAARLCYHVVSASSPASAAGTIRTAPAVSTKRGCPPRFRPHVLPRCVAAHVSCVPVPIRFVSVPELIGDNQPPIARAVQGSGAVSPSWSGTGTACCGGLGSAATAGTTRRRFCSIGGRPPPAASQISFY